MGKRRPLVIRKNNFVLTAKQQREESSNESGAGANGVTAIGASGIRESSFAAATNSQLGAGGGGPLSTTNTIGINRIIVDSFNSQSA